MNVFSLFSGIGGIDLGLQRAGMAIVGQCEIDPYCRAVLTKHFPQAWRHTDVRTLTGDLIVQHCGHIDLIAGGFPCQDVSDAGFKEGISGARSGLWSEFNRLVCEVRTTQGSAPEILIENVDGLRRRGLHQVLGDLAAGGYDAEWRVLGASDFGAPHIRERIFILAHAAGFRRPGHASHDQVMRESVLEKAERSAKTWPIAQRRVGLSGKFLPDAGFLRMDDGLPSRLDVRRVAACGNAVVPAVIEAIGRAIIQSKDVAA